MITLAKCLSAALLVLPAMLHAQNTISFTVQGKVGHYSAPYKAYLSYSSPSKGYHTDSVVMMDGTFSFTDSLPTPRKANLVISTGSGRSNDNVEEICLEQGIIRVTSPDSLQNSQVSGGKVNADFTLLKKMRKQENNLDDRMRIDKEFMKEYPQSWVDLILIYEYTYWYADMSKYRSAFEALSAEQKASSIGRYTADKLKAADKTAIGMQAPDFTLPDVSGKAISLHDYKGKYVLIDFWASWCGPCRAENPNVLKAFNDYKAKGFNVLGISLDDSAGKAKWIEAIRKDVLPWTQVSDLKGFYSAAALLYSVEAIPQNFLAGPDGNILAKNLRGEDLEKKLKELLH